MKVLFLLYLVCVSFESMRDYAGFGYASLDLVMPHCCFAGFGYVSFVFVVSVMFL